MSHQSAQDVVFQTGSRTSQWTIQTISYRIASRRIHCAIFQRCSMGFISISDPALWKKSVTMCKGLASLTIPNVGETMVDFGIRSLSSSALQIFRGGSDVSHPCQSKSDRQSCEGESTASGRLPGSACQIHLTSSFVALARASRSKNTVACHVEGTDGQASVSVRASRCTWFRVPMKFWCPMILVVSCGYLLTHVRQSILVIQVREQLPPRKACGRSRRITVSRRICQKKISL